MLRAVLNVTWREHLPNMQLYGNLCIITEVIKERRVRFVGHSFRNKAELVSDLILWKPTMG